MSKPSPQVNLPVIAGLLAMAGLQLPAANYFVSVDDSGFSPATQTISVGDTVLWVNLDGSASHSTTSDLPVTDPNYWSGLMLDFLDTFSQQFNSVGTFSY